MIYSQEETIAAITTPPGEGGVAIVRISGKEAVAVASKVFSGDVSSYATHTAHYGKFLNDTGEVVDTGLCLVMLDGRSYTGEQVVELQGHGGPIVSRRVLAAVLAAGARAAAPGEFTFRAYMNGKIDLAQAEAVQALIGAKNEMAVDAAADQLQGRLSKKISQFQKDLTEVAAILEAWVDFPEEGLEFATFDELTAELDRISQHMATLRDTFEDGRKLQEGIAVALIGLPNVGKSSLMNALLNKERAIVTHVAGTTRDLLEEEMRLGGLHLRLIDTAGIRDTDEIVEQEGIRRSKEAMARADLVLFILDATRERQPAEEELLDALDSNKSIVIYNKVDLAPNKTGISAKLGTGIDQLLTQIEETIWHHGPPAKDHIYLTNLRHKEALIDAIDATQKTVYGLQSDLSPELICLDLRQALYALATIHGNDVTQDLLNSIFSKFCLGK